MPCLLHLCRPDVKALHQTDTSEKENVKPSLVAVAVAVHREAEDAANVSVFAASASAVLTNLFL